MATLYVVFALNAPDEDVWKVLGTYTAASADAAKKAAAVEHGAGTYSAATARSWKPATFKVEQTTKVTLASAPEEVPGA